MQKNLMIEVVRGRMDDAQAEELLAFWAANGALAGDEARARLPEVVCLVRDGGGAVVGACSVYAAALPLISGRRFWVFRSLLPGAAAESWPALVSATFTELDERFDGQPGSPIGLCVLPDDDELRRRPEAEWADPPRMIHAGFADGRPVRIAYFDGASMRDLQTPVATEWPPLSGGHRIELFAEQDAVSEQDLVDLWTSENVLSRQEAERRLGEVLLVATDGDGRPVGISSAYLEHNEQLGTELWYYRAFVAHAHRRSALAVWLAVNGRVHLSEQYLTGRDRRAPGMIYEVENEGLKTRLHSARWQPTEFLFIGENARGAHVRVHWFPGAPAPEPPQGST